MGYVDGNETSETLFGTAIHWMIMIVTTLSINLRKDNQFCINEDIFLIHQQGATNPIQIFWHFGHELYSRPRRKIFHLLLVLLLKTTGITGFSGYMHGRIWICFAGYPRWMPWKMMQKESERGRQWYWYLTSTGMKESEGCDRHVCRISQHTGQINSPIDKDTNTLAWNCSECARMCSGARAADGWNWSSDLYKRQNPPQSTSFQVGRFLRSQYFSNRPFHPFY